MHINSNINSDKKINFEANNYLLFFSLFFSFFFISFYTYVVLVAFMLIAMMFNSFNQVSEIILHVRKTFENII